MSSLGELLAGTRLGGRSGVARGFSTGAFFCRASANPVVQCLNSFHESYVGLADGSVGEDEGILDFVR